MSIKAGTKVSVISAGLTNDHYFDLGEGVTANGEMLKHLGVEWYGFLSDKGKFQWMKPSHYKVLEAESVTEVVKPTKTSKKLPKKTLYAVVIGGEAVDVTDDREEAREIKFDLGGLRNGVTIVKYVAQKEIR